MGCDPMKIKRARPAVQLLVMGLWLQHISGSLSVTSAIKFSGNSNDDSGSGRFGDSALGNNKNNKDDDVEEMPSDLVQLRITRNNDRRSKRKYEDYSDDVVSKQTEERLGGWK